MTPQEAIAAHDAARHTLASATAAAARARASLAHAEARVEELSSGERERIRLHALRLEDWTRKGGGGAPPALVADANDVHASATARATAEAARESLGRLEAEESEARSLLSAAEAALTEAATALRRAQMDRIADRLAALRREEYALCARIVATSIDCPAAMTDRAALALNGPPSRPSANHFVGARHIAPDIHSPLGGDPGGIDQARNFWREYEACSDDVEKAA